MQKKSSPDLIVSGELQFFIKISYLVFYCNSAPIQPGHIHAHTHTTATHHQGSIISGHILQN